LNDSVRLLSVQLQKPFCCRSRTGIGWGVQATVSRQGTDQTQSLQRAQRVFDELGVQLQTLAQLADSPTPVRVSLQQFQHSQALVSVYAGTQQRTRILRETRVIGSSHLYGAVDCLERN
jgi:hypothetical protein